MTVSGWHLNQNLAPNINCQRSTGSVKRSNLLEGRFICTAEPHFPSRIAKAFWRVVYSLLWVSSGCGCHQWKKKQIILIKLVDRSSLSKRKVHKKKAKDWPPSPSLGDKCIRCSVNQVHINRQRPCVFQRLTSLRWRLRGSIEIQPY